MEKFITKTSPITSGSTSWSGNTGKLRQAFKGLTGYDIMFEESRKDIMPVPQSLAYPHSGQVISGMLSNSIKKCLVLLGRE